MHDSQICHFLRSQAVKFYVSFINRSVDMYDFSIISGGQTGVDRAALDVALKWRIPYRGWCPAGRLAEDGIIPVRYVLRETPTSDVFQRTIWNVRDSDGVVIIGSLDSSRGTILAYQTAIELHRPVVQCNLLEGIHPVIQWLEKLSDSAINIVGPRESEERGIYSKSFHFLDHLICNLQGSTSL